MEQKNESEQSIQPKKTKLFRIGIIVNETNLEDIKHYNDQFRMINKRYKNSVTLLFFGYNPEKDRFNSLEGVDYEYVKPVSEIHYFKQFNACELNLVFVPLVKSNNNQSSKNIDEFIEAGLFKIPLLVCDIYPFNRVIQNDLNGFIYGEKVDFKAYLEDLLAKRIGIVERAGINAYDFVTKRLNFSDENINLQSEIFS